MSIFKKYYTILNDDSGAVAQYFKALCKKKSCTYFGLTSWNVRRYQLNVSMAQTIVVNVKLQTISMETKNKYKLRV